MKINPDDFNLLTIKLSKELDTFIKEKYRLTTSPDEKEHFMLMMMSVLTSITGYYVFKFAKDYETFLSGLSYFMEGLRDAAPTLYKTMQTEYESQKRLQ